MAISTIENLVVIGAKGNMGALFVERAKVAGIKVHTLDKPLDMDVVEHILPRTDAVILSIPVTAFSQVLDTIVPHLGEDTILTDVCSVKEIPLNAMLKAYDGPVVGTHPLFGPVIPEDLPPRVAVTPGRNDEAATAISALMRRLGFQPFTTTVENHDKAMAYVQGLNFTTTVAYLSAMREVDDIEKFMTPSLKRRLESARKMVTADKELFALITGSNPYLQETIRVFKNYLSVAAGGDLDLLANRAGWWWRNDQTKGRV
ncbi:MAG: prephenate dehydrogenase/arogenate dehydrogenase family protein [Desulfovibrio sp.]